MPWVICQTKFMCCYCVARVRNSFILQAARLIQWGKQPEFTFQTRGQQSQRSCFSQLYLFLLNSLCTHDHRGIPQRISLELTINYRHAYLKKIIPTGRFPSDFVVCLFQIPWSSSLISFHSYSTQSSMRMRCIQYMHYFIFPPMWLKVMNHLMLNSLRNSKGDTSHNQWQ